MARNSVFLSSHNFKQKEMAVKLTSLKVVMYLREFLWNTLTNFLAFCYSVYGKKLRFRMIRNDSIDHKKKINRLSVGLENAAPGRTQVTGIHYTDLPAGK